MKSRSTQRIFDLIQFIPPPRVAQSHEACSLRALSSRLPGVCVVLEVLADFPRLFATLDAQAKKRLLRSVVAEVKINEEKDQHPEIRLLEPWATLLEPVTGDAADPEALSETA